MAGALNAEVVPPAALSRPAPVASLAVVSGVTVVLYVATSTIHITGSLQVGDLWMLVAGIAVLLSPAAMADVLRLVTGSYGVMVLMLTGCMLIASLNSRTFLHSVSFVAQMVFVLWVTVPVIAAGVARMHDPLRFIRLAGLGYLAVYFAGLVLLFGAGKDTILYQSAIGRVFQWPVTHVFQMSLMAVSAAGLAVGTSHRLRDMILLLLSFIPILLNASRTGLVGFGLLAALGLCAALTRVRRLPWVLVGLAAIAVGGTTLVTSSAFQNLWQIRVLSTIGFLEDDIRLRSVLVSWSAIRSSTMTMLFGDGWGTSGGDIVVHNVVVQVWHEGGVFVLLAMLLLLALPIILPWLRPTANSMVRLTGVMLGSLNLTFWMLNALSVERAYWLAFAVSLGLAYHAQRDSAGIA